LDLLRLALGHGGIVLGRVSDSFSFGVNELGEKLWNNNFIKIFIIATFCNLAHQMLLTTMPYYVIVLGASPSQAGVMAGLLTVAALITRPFVGHFADSKGRKNITIFGIIVFAIGTVVFITCPNIYIIMIFRVLQGVGIACMTTANATIATDVLPQKHLAQGIAYFGLSSTAATSVGPAIAIALMTSGSYNTMFGTSLIAIGLAFGILSSLGYEKQIRLERQEYFKLHPQEVQKQELERTQNAQKLKETNILWRIFEKSAFKTSMVYVLVSMSMSCVLAFLPSFAISKGIENSGVFFTMTAVVILVVRVATGKLYNKIPTIVLVVSSIAVFGLSMISISFLNGFAHLMMSAVLYGAGAGVVIPTMNAIAVKYAPRDKRGNANATFLCSYDIGSGIGAALWGFVIDYMGGYSVAFVGAGICCMIAIVMSIFLLKNKSLKS